MGRAVLRSGSAAVRRSRACGAPIRQPCGAPVQGRVVLRSGSAAVRRSRACGAPIRQPCGAPVQGRVVRRSGSAAVRRSRACGAPIRQPCGAPVQGRVVRRSAGRAMRRRGAVRCADHWAALVSQHHRGTFHGQAYESYGSAPCRRRHCLASGGCRLISRPGLSDASLCRSRWCRLRDEESGRHVPAWQRMPSGIAVSTAWRICSGCSASTGPPPVPRSERGHLRDGRATKQQYEGVRGTEPAPTVGLTHRRRVIGRLRRRCALELALIGDQSAKHADSSRRPDRAPYRSAASDGADAASAPGSAPGCPRRDLLQPPDDTRGGATARPVPGGGEVPRLSGYAGALRHAFRARPGTGPVPKASLVTPT